MTQEQFDQMLEHSPLVKGLRADLDDMRERLCANEFRARNACGDAGQALAAATPASSPESPLSRA